MPEMPPELAAALAMRKHARARKAFDAFAPSHRREYIEWIAGARGEDTRARRLAQALEWLAEGQTRHWKYAKCCTSLSGDRKRVVSGKSVSVRVEFGCRRII